MNKIESYDLEEIIKRLRKEVKKLKAEGKSAKLQNVLPLVKPIWEKVKKETN